MKLLAFPLLVFFFSLLPPGISLEGASDDAWTVLRPKRFSSSNGSSLTKLDDGSLLASGSNPKREVYRIVVRTTLRGITAFRLEALSDRSLPSSGPGRATNGNFVLTGFRVQVSREEDAKSGTPVALKKAEATFWQTGHWVGDALDGRDKTGWAVWPKPGRGHSAMFVAKRPLGREGDGLTLIFTLEYKSDWGFHTLGRFRLSATTKKKPLAQLTSQRQKRVDLAIRKGISYVKRKGSPQSRVGNSDELILWTLVHAGVPESDPQFRSYLKRILAAPLERTYKVAIQAMILEELHRVRYQDRIWQCAKFLVNNQCSNGQWSYGTLVKMKRRVRTGSSTKSAPLKVDKNGRRIKPRVRTRRSVTRTRWGPASGDNSNSQYATLGLLACRNAGVRIPQDTVRLARQWWHQSILPDRGKENETRKVWGWNYRDARSDKRGPYHPMTAGAVGSLLILNHLQGIDGKNSRFVRAGMAWLHRHHRMHSNYYYLYALERVGMLAPAETIGGRDWYGDGVMFLLKSQGSDGSWDNHNGWTVWDTCFAILFLRRATRALEDVTTTRDK